MRNAGRAILQLALIAAQICASQSGGFAVPTPSQLAGCKEQVPLLNIERQFDFGQFITLYQDDPEEPARITLDPGGTLPPTTNARSHFSIGRREQQTLGGVSLQRLLSSGSSTNPLSSNLTSLEAMAALKTGSATVNGKTYRLILDDHAREMLASGQVAAIQALEADSPNKRRVTLELVVAPEPVPLDDEALSRVISSGLLGVSKPAQRVKLGAEAIAALLAGKQVRLWTSGDAPRLVELRPTAANRVADSNVSIGNLPEFLARPYAAGIDGRPVPLALTPQVVHALLSQGKADVKSGNSLITLWVETEKGAKEPATINKGMGGGKRPSGGSGTESGANTGANENVPPPTPTDRTIDIHTDDSNEPPDGNEGGDATGPVGTVAFITPTITATYTAPPYSSGEPAAPYTGSVRKGIELALFAPWRQTWKLVGYSRGSLLQSLALAPREEVIIEISSWSRRTRSLQQSTEADTEQSFESAQTSKDTEEIFQELTARHDFSWQLEGSVDASYSNGIASVEVHVGGAVQKADSLQNVARNTQSHIKESALKAATKVRSKRLTRIMESSEEGSQNRVTRRIRNENLCHTLTIDYFETLAHYEITTAFRPERLRIVALVPNPSWIGKYTREMVRRNEGALRRAILDGSLNPGFDACRLNETYDQAIRILAAQAAAGKASEEANNSLRPPGQTNTPVASPQQSAMIEALAGIGKSFARLSSNADPSGALSEIKRHLAVDDVARNAAQRWLFLRLLRAKLPGLLSALGRLTPTGSPDMAMAADLAAALPKPGQATTPASLNELPNAEKEDLALASAIKSPDMMEILWDWGYWIQRCHEEGLYTPNDDGLIGKLDHFAQLYQDWESKRTEGGMAVDKEIALAQVDAKQNQASFEDKLSSAFPLDSIAAALEREQALLAHLNEHLDHYGYALFQALAPAEQVTRIIEASSGALTVGTFEPRVIAMNGKKLAVPLSPLAGTDLNEFAANLGNVLKAAFDGVENLPETAVVPTPGITMTTRLGECSTCEDYIEKARESELMRLDAITRQEQAEAQRREALIGKAVFDPFVAPPSGLDVTLNNRPE
jgi:hypothetical protein